MGKDVARGTDCHNDPENENDERKRESPSLCAPGSILHWPWWRMTLTQRALAQSLNYWSSITVVQAGSRSANIVRS
jgi:hypothetical protein